MRNHVVYQYKCDMAECSFSTYDGYITCSLYEIFKMSTQNALSYFISGTFTISTEPPNVNYRIKLKLSPWTLKSLLGDVIRSSKQIKETKPKLTCRRTRRTPQMIHTLITYPPCDINFVLSLYLLHYLLETTSSLLWLVFALVLGQSVSYAVHQF